MADANVAARREAHVARMERKQYEEELAQLHVELVQLQEWVKREGLSISSATCCRGYVPEKC